MNIRITPRDAPNRTDTYTGVAAVSCDGKQLKLHPSKFMGRPGNWIGLPLREIAEVALDEDGAWP